MALFRAWVTTSNFSFLHKDKRTSHPVPSGLFLKWGHLTTEHRYDTVSGLNKTPAFAYWCFSMRTPPAFGEHGSSLRRTVPDHLWQPNFPLPPFPDAILGRVTYSKQEPLIQITFYRCEQWPREGRRLPKSAQLWLRLTLRRSLRIAA